MPLAGLVQQFGTWERFTLALPPYPPLSPASDAQREDRRLFRLPFEHLPNMYLGAFQNGESASMTRSFSKHAEVTVPYQ